MADDFDIRREVWESKIAVEFHFLASELSTIEKPKPIYFLIPRVSYLPLVTEKLQKYINSVIGEEEIDEIWFEYNGNALKWHYPVGVLFDCFGIDESLPWSITVHVKNFPEDEILHCRTKDIIESVFIQTVKEADQIKHRGRIIENMTKEDHKKLWYSLANDRFEQFWSVNRRLMEDTIEHPMKFIPIRIYQPDQLHFIQKLVKPVKDDDGKTTIEDVLRIVFSQFFLESDKFRVVTHGVEVPYDTPLIWLAETMCYPENFVHLCISSK